MFAARYGLISCIKQITFSQAVSIFGTDGRTVQTKYVLPPSDRVIK